MRVIILVTAFSLALTVHAQDTDSRNLVADALDWYSVWFASAPPTQATLQTCRGELRSNSYEFRCDPLSVVVDVITDPSGHCEITNMRPAISPDDGLRALTLEHLIPPGIPIRKGAAPRDCGELPVTNGAFQLTVMPRARPVSGELSRNARSAALDYNARGGDNRCLLHFPKVKMGDPFFHVYEECQGTLDTVWEFGIIRGQVQDYAAWYYTLRKRDLPPGIKWRRNTSELWFGTSRPEDRAGPER